MTTHKAIFVGLALGLSGLCGGACGGAGQPASSATASYLASDEDPSTDDQGKKDDDHLTLSYGSPATQTERAQIADIVRRYYAAAAADDGTGACALASRRLSSGSNLESYVPEEFRPAPGSALFRGKGCAQVESLVFSVDRSQLAEQAASAQLIAARVKGSIGLAFVGFRSAGEREIDLAREGGSWKVDLLADKRLP